MKIFKRKTVEKKKNVKDHKKKLEKKKKKKEILKLFIYILKIIQIDYLNIVHVKGI